MFIFYLLLISAESDHFKMKRMAVLDQSSYVFTTLQESLRIQKDSILGIMDKDWSTTFKFVPPCRNELLCSKTAVSFMASRLRSSVAETSRLCLIQD